MSSNDKVIIRKEFFEGVKLFEEGEDATEAFVIETGEVEVYRTENGIRKIIAAVGVGETLGEMALIKGSKRSASAVAKQKTRVAIISKEAMTEKLDNCDPLIKTMLHRLTDRLQKSNKDLLN